MASEPIFQLGAVERRLLELLLGVGEWLDLEHHERVPGDVRGRQRGKIAVHLLDASELEDALEPMERAIAA